MEALRLVTYNTRHGLGDDGRVDVDRFADAVAALDADVLALQEVEVASPRSHRSDLPVVAARAMGAVEVRFAATMRRRRWGWVAIGAGPVPASVPRYGIALASRFPVERWWRLRLPRPGPAERVREIAVTRVAALRRGTRSAGLGGILRGARVPREEPRTALAARVRTPYGPVTVVATHLAVSRGRAIEQLDALLAATSRLPGPVAVLGDLNLGPADATGEGWRSMASEPTYPVDRPTRQIDHVLANGDLVAVGRGVAIDTGVSDHRALAAVVRPERSGEASHTPSP